MNTLRQSHPALARKLLFPMVVASFVVLILSCEKGVGISPISQECGLTFEQAKLDSSHARDYFQQRAACLEEVKVASASGKLIEVLFDPTDEVLRVSMEKAYSKNGLSTQDIALLVDATLTSREKVEAISVAEISSTNPSFFGRSVPVFIIFNKRVFSSTLVQNNHDVYSILLHEIQHVIDWHDGIALVDRRIDNKAWLEKSFSDAWLVNIMELRAVYKELAGMYQNQVVGGSLLVSNAWFASQAGNYATHWRQSSETAVTGTEVTITGYQKEEFKGVVPEIVGDTLYMHFDLYGKKNTAVFIAPSALPKQTREGLWSLRNWSR